MSDPSQPDDRRNDDNDRPAPDPPRRRLEYAEPETPDDYSRQLRRQLNDEMPLEFKLLLTALGLVVGLLILLIAVGLVIGLLRG